MYYSSLHLLFIKKIKMITTKIAEKQISKKHAFFGVLKYTNTLTILSFFDVAGDTAKDKKGELNLKTRWFQGPIFCGSKKRIRQGGELRIWDMTFFSYLYKLSQKENVLNYLSITQCWKITQRY